MNVTVSKDGKKLTLEMDLQPPTESKSGKTLIVASTNGNKATGVKVNNKELFVGVNAYIYAKEKGTGTED